MAVFVAPLCLDQIVDYVVQIRENLEEESNATDVVSTGNFTAIEVCLRRKNCVVMRMFL